MRKVPNTAYLYQISTNPIHQKSPILSMNEQDGGFGFGGDLSVVTGMNNSIEATIESIKNSALVYISNEVDATTYFELGLAIAMGKTVYYVTECTENQLEVLLPYHVAQVTWVSLETFIRIVEKKISA